MRARPPRWMDRFLEWYCNPKLLEEIQGDTHELFERTLASKGKLRAELQFSWNVLRFFRWSVIRRGRDSNQIIHNSMMLNFFKTGTRQIMRNKSMSLINISGLSLGIGIAITVFLFIDFMLRIDHFHENGDRIFQVISNVPVNDQLQLNGETPWPLGSVLPEDHSEVAAAARVKFGAGAVKYKDAVFQENIWFVDPAFMEIFSFPVVSGRKDALTGRQSIVITTRTAERYFGNDNPIGQNLSIKFENGVKQDFTIAAVVGLPETSGIRFRILIPVENINLLVPSDARNWAYNSNAAFVLLNRELNPMALEDATNRYIELQNQSNPGWSIASFSLIPLRKISKMANEITGPISFGASPHGIWSMAAIAAMLLLLASFNYMNVAVSAASLRLKEIGVRKVIGSNRGDLVLQFMTENLLLCSLALFIGLLLSSQLFLPGLNALYPFEIPFMGSGFTAILLFLASLLLFVTLVSGAYPSLYIAGFSPLGIITGRSKFGQRSLFSRVLLTIQFTLAFTTIVFAFVFIYNAVYQRDRDWGYDHARTFVVPFKTEQQYLGLRDLLTHVEGVRSVGACANHIGVYPKRLSFDNQSESIQTVLYEVDFNYAETMQLRLAAGRFFSKEIASDHTESVMINEAFARRLKWSNPLGMYFELEGKRYYVIGLLQDFHFNGFYSPVEPVIIRITSEENLRYMAVTASGDNLGAIVNALATGWKSIAPDDPFEGFYQDEVFEDFHRDNNANIILLYFISFISVSLACLGLYGLVSFNLTRRMREFSIRKVFGARLPHIVRLMNRDHLLMVLLSFCCGAPAGYWFISSLIYHIYPDPRPTGILPFFLAIGLMLGSAAITILLQLRRVTVENPAVTLRSE